MVHKKFAGFFAGLLLFTPIEEFFLGRVLFPRMDGIPLLGISLMVFFGFKILKHYKGGRKWLGF